MFSYRLAQHKTASGDRFQFDSGLPMQMMMTSEGGLALNGWITSGCGVVRGMQLTVVNNRRRELPAIDNLTKGTGDKLWFHHDLGDLPDLQSGDDIAIEVAAMVADRTHPLFTLTLVRDDCVSPAIFIVGSPRSGTTVVGNSLRKVLDAEAGFGESHLLPLAGEVVKTVAEFHQSSGAAAIPGMMLHHVNPHLLAEQMLSVIKRQYSNLFAQGCILDKTPGGAMIRALPDIQRLWPEARIIFVKRRGIENVVSRLKKFPEVDFKSHCSQWKNCMNAWDWVKGGLVNKIEVDQFDVLTQPVLVAKRLGDFLDLPSVQISALERHFSSDKPEQTRSVSHSALSINNVNWNNEQKSFFIQHCAENLERWGYSQDESYYLNSVAH